MVKLRRIRPYKAYRQRRREYLAELNAELVRKCGRCLATEGGNG